MLKNPQPYLNAIREGIKDGNPSWESDQELSDRIRGLAYSINQEIISAESKDWGNPSPARLKIIEKWGSILEPYTKELLVLAIEESATRENSSTQASSLLDFAGPTKQFEQHVRYYLTESKPKTASAAAYLLYRHRLLTSADIDTLRGVIQSNKQSDGKGSALISLSFYGAADGITIAQEILRSDPQSNVYEKLIARYRDALDLIQNLGPAAESLLPDLDALMLKISGSQQEESKLSILNKLQYARDLVTGKQPMQERFAANGSGPLPLKVGDLPQQKTQDDASRKDATRERPELRRPSVTSNASDAIAKEKSPFPWLTIVSLVGLLALSLVGLLNFRKSKHTP